MFRRKKPLQAGSGVALLKRAYSRRRWIEQMYGIATENRCSKCNRYYDKRLTKCPVCGTGHSERRNPNG